jgi:cysteinyl-tRNA synthetase
MLRIYNTLTREIEEFYAAGGKKVSMYSCGPTVYDYIHIGNIRTFLFADVLRRWLEYSNYTVKQVMNITDVGHMLHDADTGADKVEEAATKEKISPQEITAKYTEYFFKTVKALNIEPAFAYPKATENVPQMIEIIKKLLKKGFAYEVDGDIYYDVEKFSKYGWLSGNLTAMLEAGYRVEVNSKKKNPLDFALWIKNPNHIMQWPSPWGNGYPGWHIECSAMSMRYLGEMLDIHTGGEDNKFPHHECEIAQSEGATGKEPFVRYWLHASHLLVDGKKMAKSDKNFYTLDDLVKKGYEPRVVRYALTSAHYREQQNFTFAALDSARSAIAKLDAVWSRLSEKNKPKTDKDPVDLDLLAMRARENFTAAMDDDLNVPKALGVLFDFVRDVNSGLDVGADGLKAAEKFINDAVFGVFGLELRNAAAETVPATVSELLNERETARRAKDYKKADEIRGKINLLGFEIDDGATGARVRKI